MQTDDILSRYNKIQNSYFSKKDFYGKVKPGQKDSFHVTNLSKITESKTITQVK